MPTAVFHVQTAYHLLCAVAIARTLPEGRTSHLIAVPMHQSQSAFFGEAWPLLLQEFDGVHLLSTRPAHKHLGRLGRPVQATLNRLRIERILRDVDQVESVFSSNLQTVEGMAVAAEGRRLQPTAEVALVEDGLATYEKTDRDLAWDIPDHPELPRLDRLAIRGRAAHLPLEQIAMPVVDRLLATIPTALDATQWKRPIGRIDHGKAKPFLQALIRRFTDVRGPFAEGLSMLVLPPLSGTLSEREQRELSRVVAQHGGSVAIKYHPREPGPFLRAAAPNAQEIRQDIPAELVVLEAAQELDWVVTGRTTSVLNTWCFAPGARVGIIPGTELPPRLLGNIPSPPTLL